MNIIIALLYLIFFAFLIYKLKFFKLEGISKKVMPIILILKVIAGTALFLIYTYYYTDRSTADIFKYFDDSKVMYDALFVHPIDYFKMLLSINNDNAYFSQHYYNEMENWYRVYENNLHNDSHTIIRVNAVFRLFSFGSYHVHTVFMCMLSLLGLTYLYKVFVIYLKNNFRELFFIIFLLPSVLLWSSGVLKEGLLIFALGLLLFQTQKLLYQGFSVWSIISLLFAIVLLFYSKFYVLIAIVPAIIAYVITHFFNNKYSYITYISVLVAYVAIGINIKYISLYDPLMIMTLKQQDFIGLAEFVNSGSYINIPLLKPNILSFICNAPFALYVVFLRPFFFESTNPFMLMAGLENLFFIISFILIIIFFRKNRKQINMNVFLLSITFVIGLYLMIGLITPVLGAVVRYKVPAFPFIFIILLLILDKDKLIKRIPFFRFLSE